MTQASTIPAHVRFGLSEEYWQRITPRDHALYELIRPMRTATFKADHFFRNLEQGLASLEKSATANGGVFELNPDFQRGHVWDEARQVAFVENIFRGVAPTTFKFNSAGWNSLSEVAGDLHPNTIVCVDGLQRLTAVRRFIAGEIKAFGLLYEELEGTAFHPGSLRVSIEMFDIKHREELLQFYLDLNSGGVVHSDAELQRVRALLDATRVNPPAPVQVPRSGTSEDARDGEEPAVRKPVRRKTR